MQDYPARILTYTKEKLEVNLSLTIQGISEVCTKDGYVEILSA